MIVQTGNGSIPVRINLDEDFYEICHMDFDDDGLLITIEDHKEHKRLILDELDWVEQYYEDMVMPSICMGCKYLDVEYTGGFRCSARDMVSMLMFKDDECDDFEEK